MSMSEKKLALIQLFQATVEQLKYTTTLCKPVYLTREDAEEILEALCAPESNMPNSYKLSQSYLQTDVLDREEGRNTIPRLSFKTEKEKEERREELLYKWELLIRKLSEDGLLTKEDTK